MLDARTLCPMGDVVTKVVRGSVEPGLASVHANHCPFLPSFHRFFWCVRFILFLFTTPSYILFTSPSTDFPRLAVTIVLLPRFAQRPCCGRVLLFLSIHDATMSRNLSQQSVFPSRISASERKQQGVWGMQRHKLATLHPRIVVVSFL